MNTHNLRWQPFYSFKKWGIQVEARDWLLEAGSLTERLKKLCGSSRSFHVHVINQHFEYASLADAATLNIKPGLKVLLREVHLLCDQTVWVYARSIIPVTTFQGRLQRLKLLGNRSLGSALFADPSMRRSELHITRVPPGEIMDHSSDNDCVWGRRSVFYLLEQPLLVAEFFLPALLKQTGVPNEQ